MLVLAVLGVFAAAGAAPAHALIGSLTKTAQTTVNTTTSSPTTLLQPVTQVVEPAAQTIIEPVVETVDENDPFDVIPDGYDPLSPLFALVGGEQGFLTTLEDLVCPVVEENAELLALAGASLIADGITTLACQASVLEYSIYTRFQRPGGEDLVREQIATLGVPTPINVDEDIEPDLIATISLVHFNQIGLVVERVATETAPLPVSVEAVLHDPTRGSLGRDRIAFGYDARGDRAPKNFLLATSVDTILQPSPTFNLTLEQFQPGARTAIIGGIFDGGPSQRVDPAEVRLDYGRSPTLGTISAGVGDDDVTVTLSQNVVGPASVSGRIVEGVDEQRFRANLADLPSTLTVTASQAGGATEAALTASAPIGRIDGSFERLRNLATPQIAQKAVFDLHQVPVGVSLRVSGDDGAVSTTGGPIGHTRIGAANGEPVFLVDQNAYLKLHEEGTLRSVAAAIPGLRNASFTLGGAPQISAEIAPTPFLVRITRPGESFGADVLDLPARFDIALDVEGGTLSYDGHGTGIGRLTLAGDATQPFFARATKLRGTIEGIPAAMTATLGFDAAGATVDVDGGALDKVELLASNGSEDGVAGTTQGVVFRDLTGGDYLVAARILGLRRIAFAGGEQIALDTHTAGGPFSIAAATDGFTADGLIADLPAKAALTAALAEGRITFAGRDGADQPAGINALDLEIAASDPLFARANHLKAHLGQIPADVTLAVAQGGSGADITATDGIGLVELVAANRPAQAGDLPAGGEQGARLVDLTGGEFVVGARVRELKRLSATLGDAIGLTAHTAGGPFGVRIVNDELDGLARIEDLPPQIDLSLDPAGGRVSISGRDAAGQPQGIERLLLDIDAEQPLFARATDLHGRIEDLPADVVLDLAQSGSGLELTSDQPIGLVEVAADDRDIADPQALLPADGEQGAVYRDTADRFTVGARVRELRRLSADLTDSLAVTALTAGGPFSVLLDANGMQADAQLRDLPADVALALDPAAGTFSYRGKDAAGNPAGVGLVTVDVTSADPRFGRATDLSARIENLSDSVDLTLAPDAAGGPTVDVLASTPISKLEFLASDGATAALPAPLDDPAAQGAVLRDRTGQPYVAALRVLDLKRVALRFGDAMGVEAETRGGPFVVDVDTDALGIDADILDLPAKANLALDLAGGTIGFDGFDAAGAPTGIDLLTVEGRLGEPVLGRADRIAARIEKLPASVDVGFSQAGGTASLTASAPVQLIELFGWESGQAKPVLAADQGALLHDRSGQPFQLAARIRQLQQLSVDFADDLQLTTKTAGGLFTADVLTEDLAAQATIDQLPTDLSLALDLASGQVSYSGSSTINRIFAAIESEQPVFLGATAFEVDLKQVPQSFTLGLGSQTDRIQLSADNPIGQIDVRARSANRSFPAIAAGEAGAVFESRDDALALALRVFQLKNLDVTLSPMSLAAEMQGGRRFLVDADVEQDGGAVLRLDGVIDQLPSRVRLALEDNVVGGVANGSRLVLDNSAPIGFVRLAVDGLELLPGADKVEAELNDIPNKLTVTLPETGTLARVEGRNGANTLTPIGQIRLAASNGSKTLPAFVSDAQYNSNPSNSGFRDRLEFDNSPTNFGVALRLTAPKVIEVDLDPIAITLEQDGARTRPIAINATIPNSTAGRPATTVSGLLNKPSARTVLGVTVASGAPTRLNFENAAAVGSLSINAANLGTIPAANFSLSNIPTKLNVCLDTSSQCRRTDRLPTALSNYGSFQGNPSQNATAGGQNRPYPAQVSMNFDDQGTSGTSSSTSSMVTLNASVTLSAGATPITISNLRFHSLSLDLGQHPTSPTFSYLGQSIPRIYMYIDSVAAPFVMNEVKYPPNIESFKIGTDGSPANGNRRLVWLPGTRCTASVFGACIATGLDTRTSGSLNCGGQRNLTIKVLGININLLSFLGQQILPVCS